MTSLLVRGYELALPSGQRVLVIVDESGQVQNPDAAIAHLIQLRVACQLPMPVILVWSSGGQWTLLSPGPEMPAESPDELARRPGWLDLKLKTKPGHPDRRF